jgi:uncharacterized protein YciI
VYRAFLYDYAACEDRIHKKWVQLQKEQENLMVRLPFSKCEISSYVSQKMVEARSKKDQDAIKDASSLHIAGLSKTRTACKGESCPCDMTSFRDQQDITEYQAVIDRLIFRGQEEDSEP